MHTKGYAESIIHPIWWKGTGLIILQQGYGGIFQLFCHIKLKVEDSRVCHLQSSRLRASRYAMKENFHELIINNIKNFYNEQ